MEMQQTFQFVLMTFACVTIIDSTLTQAVDPERFFNDHDFDEDDLDVPNRLRKDESGYSHLPNVFLAKNETSMKHGTKNSFKEAFDEVRWSTNPPRKSVKKRARRKPNIMPSVVKKIVLTRALRKSYIVAHNEARKIVEPPASNMKKLHWDKELETLATSYSQKCVYEHSPTKQHKRFRWVGENLFISSGIKFDEYYAALAVRAFDSEKQFYNYTENACQTGEDCGHYAQVVWADTFRVGCGATECANVDVDGTILKKAILFVCNYTPGGNSAGVKPYKTGKGCTGCHETDKCVYDKLCSNQMRGRNFNNASMMKFTEWGTWGSCQSTCGLGMQFRTRICNTFVRKDCKGQISDGKECRAGPCKKQNKKEKNLQKNKDRKPLQNTILSSILKLLARP
ncbi:cysteine-rich secretory protein LCCL domain-containing 2-like [Styela clava]